MTLGCKCSLAGIYMWYKDAYILYPFPCVYPHAAAPIFFFFLLSLISQTTCYYSFVPVYSKFRALICPQKMEKQVHFPKLGLEDFICHCLSRPFISEAIMQLQLYTFGLHPHAKPIYLWSKKLGPSGYFCLHQLVLSDFSYSLGVSWARTADVTVVDDMKIWKICSRWRLFMSPGIYCQSTIPKSEFSLEEAKRPSRDCVFIFVAVYMFSTTTK